MYRSEDSAGFRHYYFDEDSEKGFPSVTSILDIYEDKYHLTEWARNNGEDYAEFIKHYTTTLGSETHLQIEKSTPINSYACAIWEALFAHIQFISCEETLKYEDEKIRYAGSYDNLSFIPDGLFEYRSSRSTKASNHPLAAGSAIIDLKTKALKPDSSWKLKSGKIPRVDNTSFTLKNLIQVATYANIVESDYALVAYVAQLKTKMKTHILLLTQREIEFYSRVFYNFCLDYFKYKTLEVSWEELINYSSDNYLPYTLQLCSTS